MPRLLGVAAALLAAGFTVGGASADSTRITIDARPRVVKLERVTIFGTVASPKEGEKVVIEMKECGLPYRAVVWAFTRAGGGWSVESGTWAMRSSATFRAVWGDEVSEPIRVQKRAWIRLLRQPGGFEIGVSAELVSFAGSRALFQRFDSARRSWTTVQSVVLEARRRSTLFVTADVHMRLPKGTAVRAVLPLSETRPCYLAGYSSLLRT